jgi:hypothetical protein
VKSCKWARITKELCEITCYWSRELGELMSNGADQVRKNGKTYLSGFNIYNYV